MGSTFSSTAEPEQSVEQHDGSESSQMQQQEAVPSFQSNATWGAQMQMQQQAPSDASSANVLLSKPPMPPPLPAGFQPQQLAAAPPLNMRRRSSARQQVPMFEAAAENFNDDDAMPLTQLMQSVEQPEPDPALGTDAAITLSTRVEYSAIPRGQTQDVFGLITVQAATAPEPDPSSQALEAERQPMDLICVLDVSGSMSGDKIRQVQDATRFIVEQVTPKDRVSIVTFNSQADRALRLRKMDSEGKDAANLATLRLAAQGGTSIAAGLSMALSVMEQRRQRNKVSSILLLTDGQDGSTRGQLPSLISRAHQANCSIYAFGFGADHDAALLSELAEQAHTPFTFVEDTDKIREAFAGAVGGLASIVAQGVQLTITSDVPLKNVHTPFSMTRPSDTSATITIPDIFAGERRDVLVELAVPAGSAATEQTKLLETYVRYTDLRSGRTVQTHPVTMETSRVDEPQPEAEPDQEVSAQRERVEVTRALQDAASQSDRGQFEEAQRLLEVADRRLQSNKKKTHLSEALCGELTDARDRMRSRSIWEAGGRAEVNDATQMHKMQRCTNMMQSSKGAVQKSSKQMYCNKSQASWIESSKQGF